MPVITLQLGQCGNQLGSSFFGALATELSANDYGFDAVHEYYRPGPNVGHYTARSVLIDMEPKVVAGARSAAASSGSWWRYPDKGYLVMQSGSGNNWAQGFHGYGPRVTEAAVELVRKEVEQADSLTGFLLLQSMAGGTGAGLGTYVARALRDDYHSAFITNCCVWPYESGEVIVQPYNTLFTLSHLADLSDGIVLLENEALHRTCSRLMNIARPSFGDMNGIAARALASMLLPSQSRGPYGGGGHAPLPAAARGSPGSGPGAGPGAPRRTASSNGLRAGGADGASAGLAPGGPGTPAGSAPRTSTASSSAAAAPVTAPLAELVTYLCPHPAYRMLTLRAIPQMPPTSIDFTTFTWPAILKRLRQMLVTGSVLEEGMDWSVTPQSHSPAPHHAATALSPGAPSGSQPGTPLPAGSPLSPGLAAGAAGGGVRANRAVANWLVLRGQGAADVDVSDFADPALTASWAVDPLAVSYSGAKFGRCLMSASLLSNDRRCVGPIERMLEHAYSMLASRAFVHQYETYGMSDSDFQDCFARIEDIAHRYARL